MADSVSVAEDDARKAGSPTDSVDDLGDSDSVKLSWRKKLCFGLVAVFVGTIVVVVAVEVGLQISGYESPLADPFASFVEKKKLFVSDPTGVALITAFPRSTFFHQQRFLKEKPAGTKRVFVFGGSTTYGYALDDPKHQSYVNQLGLQLSEEFPGTNFEMINCGGMSYASYRLVDLVDECVEYSPDLVIVMSGHNEFIEARHYKDLITPSATSEFWYSLKTIHLIADVSARVQSSLMTETSGLGDNPFVTERYVVRDEKEFRLTLEHYTRNINRMIEACREHDTPVILCTCPSNLLDHPPFKTEPPPNMPPEEFARQRDRAARLFETGQHAAALKIADEVLKDDPDSAVMLYIAGKCHHALGDMKKAHECLMRAKDKDDFPKRTLTSFNERVRELAAEHKLPLFDAEAQFLDAADNRLPGADLFLDDCHPNRRGHLMFAEGLRELAATALDSK